MPIPNPAIRDRTGVTPQTLDRWRLYALVDALEGDLRDVLREWVVPFKRVEEILGPRYEAVRERAADGGILVEGDTDLLNYVDFHDAFALINRNVAMVPTEVATIVKEHTPRLDSFVPVRNRVMHGRPLLPDDPDLTLRLCGDLLDARAPWPRLRVVMKHLIADPTWAPLVETLQPPAERVLHNLPVPDFDETGLIGRDLENTKLVSMLLGQRDRVLTVVGEGGVGKTALSVKSLYDVVDSSECPYDAVLWSSLKTEMLTGRGVRKIADAARDVTGITRILGQAFDDDFQGSVRDLAEALEGLTTLVVIDNLETASAREIIELHDGLPVTTSFLFTSRVGIGELERRFPLEPLSDQAAEIMFRKLAERRGLDHLKRLPAAQIRGYVRRLRQTPLAIRWFIEAVDSGAQPDDLLRDQTMLLEFCMSSIYETLDGPARELLTVLFAAERPIGLSDMTILCDLDLNDLRRSVHELRRRSLVDVHALPGAALVQTYSLAPATREYMRSAARPAEDSVSVVQDRLTELRRSEVKRRRDEARSVLMPHAVTVVSEEQKPVAHLLRQAFFDSRRGDLDSARSLIADARRLDPDYFEVPRVEAVVESGHNPDSAIELYREAYDLAPLEFRPKVAFFHAGLLASVLRVPELAEPLAEEAHDSLKSAETALRLGQIRTSLGKLESAADLLAEAADSATEERTTGIARTQLVRVARLQVEHLRRSGCCDEAVDLGTTSLKKALVAIEEGVADPLLRPHILDLMVEVTWALGDSAGAPERNEHALSLLRETAQLLLPSIGSYRRREDWDRALARLGQKGISEGSQDVRELRAALFSTRRALEDGRLRGMIHRFLAAKGGLIRPGEDSDLLSFPSESVTSETAGLLIPGTPVSYELAETEQGEEAIDVRPDISEDDGKRILTGRKGTVVKLEYAHLFAVDKLTGVFVFVHKDHFRRPSDWELVQRRDEIEYELRASEDQRWRAARGTTRLAGETSSSGSGS